MNFTPARALPVCRLASPVLAMLLGLVSTVQLTANAAHAETGVSPRLALDVTKAGPRSVESLTEQSVGRNYRNAWESLSRALQFNVLEPLEAPFTGPAREWLTAIVSSQRQSGLTQKYLDQNHRLEAVFYAPEGDVMELHDTVSYREQVWDGSHLIQDRPVVIYYIVLMTPSADRWVIRNLQAVPHF